MTNETQSTSPMEAARLAKGWSLQKLANMLEVAGSPANRSTLSRIERGDQAPRPALRKALADLLGLAVTDLPASDTP